MNKIEHQNRHFNAISEKYYRARQDKKHLLYKQLLFSYLLKSLKRKADKQMLVLEPMCGYGEGKKIVEKYINKNIVYEGFDYSDILIKKVKANIPDINIYKQDVTTFVPDKQYDIIILIGGLHHVPDYAGIICENLAKGLKKDGFFINFEPTSNNFIVKIVRNMIYRNNSLFDDMTERAFTLKELNRLYAAGLQIEKQFYPGLLAYVLWYNPDAFPKLNLGNEKMVKLIFGLEKRLYLNVIGRLFSFSTFTILKNNRGYDIWK